MLLPARAGVGLAVRTVVPRPAAGGYSRARRRAPPRVTREGGDAALVAVVMFSREIIVLSCVESFAGWDAPPDFDPQRFVEVVAQAGVMLGPWSVSSAVLAEGDGANPRDAAAGAAAAAAVFLAAAVPLERALEPVLRLQPTSDVPVTAVALGVALVAWRAWYAAKLDWWGSALGGQASSDEVAASEAALLVAVLGCAATVVAGGATAAGCMA